jgi:Carboxypeptidase regulatory-like domain
MLTLAMTAALARPIGQQAPPRPATPPGLPQPAGQPGTTPQPPVRATGFIMGRIVDADSNQPIAGALVLLQGRNPIQGGAPIAAAGGRGIVPMEVNPGPPPQVYTDGQGRFVFRDLAAGSYGLSTRALGFLPGSYGQRRINGPGIQLVLDEDARKTDVVIKLWRQASISGAVRDEAGEPVVGVQVTLLRSMVVNGRRQFAPAQSANTDDRGMYRLGGLSPGAYTAYVRSSTTSLPVTTVEEYEKPVSGQAAQTARTALMRDLSMAGVPVGMPGIQIGDQQLQTQGQFGRSLIGPLPGADARLLVYPTTFYPTATTASQAMFITLATGEEKTAIDLQLKLLPSYRVSGVVQGPDGPVANFPLKLQPGGLEEFATDFGLETASTVTDAIGQFTFLGVPTGQYTLNALRVPRPAPMPSPPPLAPGTSMVPAPTMPTPPSEPTLWARLPVSVGETDMNGVSVLLSVGLRIRGRVEFQGGAPRPTAERLQQLTVNLSVADGRSMSFGLTPARLAPDGTFTTMSVPPGKYYLSMGGPGSPWWVRSVHVGGRDAMDTPIDLQSDVSGAVITFTDQPNEISGTVQRTGSAPDDLGAVVVLVPTDYQRWLDEGTTPRRMRTASVSTAGQFTFRNLLPGDYLIAAIPMDAIFDGQDMQWFARVARAGTRLTIADGDKRSMSLTVSQVR